MKNSKSYSNLRVNRENNKEINENNNTKSVSFNITNENNELQPVLNSKETKKYKANKEDNNYLYQQTNQNLSIENFKLKEKLDENKYLQNNLFELQCKNDMLKQDYEKKILDLEASKRDNEILKIKVDDINNFQHDVIDIKAKLKGVTEYYEKLLNE